MRIATFNTELSRPGPGILLRDIEAGNDPQVEAVADVIARTAPDILLLQGVDYDHRLAALTALRDRIAERGLIYPYLFAARPNSGMASGADLDGDGRLGSPRDAQGYGEFAGQGGMAVLSRFGVDTDGVGDFSALLWQDLPGAILPVTDADMPFPSPRAQDVQRLSSVAHWVVPVRIGDTRAHLLAFHASPPVFDGPEDRNGRRNHDEIRFWQLFLDGAFGAAPEGPFVLLGDANLDPADGDGRKRAIKDLIGDPRLKDPLPRRPGPAAQGPGHTGDPRLDTVAWPEPEPGHLRVSYVLPSTDLTVASAGVHWPQAGSALAQTAETASRHRLVWVDLLID